MQDNRLRSLVKAISWRITGTIDTMIISFIITQKVGAAISIGLFEVITKTFLYYGHERVWEKIKFGRKPPEYQI